VAATTEPSAPLVFREHGTRRTLLVENGNVVAIRGAVE
jgi:hypothetical protein